MARTKKTIYKELPKNEIIAKRSTTLDGRVFITTQENSLFHIMSEKPFSLYELKDNEYHFIQNDSSPLTLDKKIPWKERD